jgi:hypothetical protein
MICPVCGETLSDEFALTDGGRPPTADSYSACLRQCIHCGIGFSNSRTAPVCIYNDPLDNIPEPVREGVIKTLGLALNVRNRNNKRSKFGFETSEDAVTWTVFTYLHSVRRLTAFQNLVNPGSILLTPQKPTLLVWGAPFPLDHVPGQRLRKQVTEILEQLGENPNSLSEPDIVLDFGSVGLVVIEVKYRSPNENKASGYPGWPTYIPKSGAFIDHDGARRSGHYELVRNWRLAWELAEDRPFTLINLGPEKLFEGEEGERLTAFESSLRQTPERRFLRMTWNDLLALSGEIPEWFRQYVSKKRLVDFNQ